jgi:hypothetical protein
MTLSCVKINMLNGTSALIILLRPVKARSLVYYSTKMGEHADTNVRIEGKQQNTAP